MPFGNRLVEGACFQHLTDRVGVGVGVKVKVDCIILDVLHNVPSHGPGDTGDTQTHRQSHTKTPVLAYSV